MTVGRLLRWGGVIGIAAAALIVTSQFLGLYAIDPRNLIGTVTTTPAGVFQITKLASVILLLVALVGLYARQAVESGVLGAISFVVAMIGTALVAGDFWYEGLVVPWLAVAAPQVLVEAATGQVAAFATVSLGSFITFTIFAVGWALFGLATAKAGVFPRVAGVVVAIGGAVAFLGGFPPYQIGLALGVGWMSGWLVVRGTADSENPRISSAAASAP